MYRKRLANTVGVKTISISKSTSIVVDQGLLLPPRPLPLLVTSVLFVFRASQCEKCTLIYINIVTHINIDVNVRSRHTC